MRQEFYVGKVRVDGLVDWVVVVTPKLEVRIEDRSIDEILQAASERGMDVMFCSTYFGMSSKRSDEVKDACVKRVKREYDVDRWDVQVEIEAKVTIYAARS